MTTTASSPALSLRDIVVTYPDGQSRTTALDGVSLDIKPGELTAVIGESGSGKSTLLSVAAGLIEPDSGTVEMHGTRGLIFQQANLLAALTAREQLLIIDHMEGRKPRGDRADELLSFVGLEGFGNRRMNQLSGGQRQRVNIARALMGQPSVLLADEPTSALDSKLSREIAKLLRGVTDDFDTATLFITHDRRLLDYADTVVEVKDGKLSEYSELAA
ncbi:ABC transporter ATP-binding protein [Corynebacterium aurimucosum]|uniref:ABC transport system, ATP-binding protein n=1 Tax=Corynebacterium aurimucosum (strain ATCC 700975 / DSM 44827 / CIP 107346 / CN-1) TaxID=548476 RepID=C3PKE2_CORA7|nr:ABC transporter ATP-binding protein [Corynebacterium aurimucosum]ACP34043.1 ABC transport system, ATP-binding protein [Corynebacterium aurimucosum ATCC 700975]QQU94245.1 ABC transporter ATP-binding protein [Corynebacterium aurimucosum]